MKKIISREKDCLLIGFVISDWLQTILVHRCPTSARFWQMWVFRHEMYQGTTSVVPYIQTKKNCHPERSATGREPGAAGERAKERAVEGPRVSFPAPAASQYFHEATESPPPFRIT